MNALRLSINAEKIKILQNIQCFINFKNLKIYIDFINWLRKYIFYYVQIIFAFQTRKIKFLKNSFKNDNVRKFYVTKIKIYDIIKKMFEL